MATQLQGTLLKSSIGVDNIRKSVVSFNKSIVSTQKTAVKINQSLVQTNREKQRSISIANTNFQRRREAVRRREREDIIEASGIGGAIKRQGKVIASSTKGFLGRIMDFVGTIMVGWLVNNLPTIIRLGEQLIDRGGKLFGVLRSFIDNVTSILSGFGSLLSGTFSNLIGFDFSNQRQLIDSTLSTIQYGMIGIENDINSAIGLLTAPLDLGFGQLDFDEGGPPPGPPTPSGSGGVGGMQAILDVIGDAESPGKGYTAIAPGDYNPNLTQMTIAEANRAVGRKGGKGAIGRYQLTNPIGQARAAGLNPDKDLFSPENQDKIALHLIRARGVTLEMIRNNPEEASVRLGAEWAGLPLLKPAGRGGVGQSYYEGYNGNRSTISVDRLKKAFSQAVSAPATPSPVTPLSRSRVVDEINVSGPSGGTPSVGLSGGSGNFGTYRTPTRSHAGIDIGTSGATGWLVGFKASGTVTYASSAGGYGLLVIIKSGNTEYYFAHLAKIMVKLGPYNGEVIGEIGKTGGDWPIHLHYEVRPNGRPIDPKPYLNLLDIGRKTAAPQTAANPTTATGIQVASAKPASTQAATQITTERKGQTIFLPMQEPTQVAQAPAPSSRGGSGLGDSSSDTSALNRYIEQSQYFQLA
jgi:murein DD-endopeptidase MepM/ murein hydrolase activator NlpD